MERIEVRFSELDDYLEEHEDLREDLIVGSGEAILEKDDEHMIVYDRWYLEIPSLNIRMYEGIYMNYDADEGNYMPDFSLSLLRDANSTDDSEYIYWEQDGFGCSMHNFCHSAGVVFDQDEICYLCYDKDE